MILLKGHEASFSLKKVIEQSPFFKEVARSSSSLSEAVERGAE